MVTREHKGKVRCAAISREGDMALTCGQVLQMITQLNLFTFKFAFWLLFDFLFIYFI